MHISFFLPSIHLPFIIALQRRRIAMNGDGSCVWKGDWKTLQMKINNRVNEKGMSMDGWTRHSAAWKCFVGEVRLLKFPTFIHVCAALDENRSEVDWVSSGGESDGSSCGVIIALLGVCFQQMWWKHFHVILWLFEERRRETTVRCGGAIQGRQWVENVFYWIWFNVELWERHKFCQFT